MEKRIDYTDASGEVIQVTPVLAVYESNNNLFVGLSYFDSEIQDEDAYCDLTVNTWCKLPYLHSAIDTSFNGPENLAFLEKNGFGEHTGSFVPSGFCNFPIFRFNEEKLREIDPEGFKEYAQAHGRWKEPLDAQVQVAGEKASQPPSKEQPEKEPER